MSDRLSLRTTLLLVGLAFGLTFIIQALLDRAPSPAAPAAPASTRSVAEAVTDEPAAAPDLKLVSAGTVPALREPRQPRKRRVHKKRKPKHRVVVKAAPKVQPAPVMRAPVQPTPAPTPRYVAPVVPRSTPVPRPRHVAPKPTPAPTTPPPSGEFDTSGDP